MRIAAVALALAAAFGFTAPVSTGYPNRPITLIVPFAIGGPTDTVARLVASSLSLSLGQRVLIENVGGAGGTRGAAQVAKASPDGYTVLLNNISQATSATLYRKLPYDPAADFETVGLIAAAPMVLVARKDFPPSTLSELVAYVRAARGKVTYGDAGVGSASHLCGILLMSALEAPLTGVPYQGTGPAMTDLVAGQIDLMCDQTINAAPQIKAGQVKAYGVTSREPVPALPDLPPLGKAGLKDFEVSVWNGLYVPKGTPKTAVERLNAALGTALDDPQVQAHLAALGADPEPRERRSPAFHRQVLDEEIGRWRGVIQSAGVFAD